MNLIAVGIFILLNTGYLFAFENVSEWEPLQIGILHDSRQFFMPRQNLVELKRAILDLHKMIETRPIYTNERQQLSRKDLAKCAPETDSNHLNMFSASTDGLQIQYTKNVSFVNQKLANFYIVLEFNTKECLNDAELLAGAKPCFYNISLDNRPSMCRMVVCLNNRIWREFSSAYDLFRHEILHGLGFGLLYPQKKAPEPKMINWRTGPFSSQLIKQNYIDFIENKTLEFARSYFNCSKLDAIPADDSQKFHLSEYHFGNELMTPILSDGPNHFTHLTASILESTHFGNISWYKVNKELVEKESQLYWYAKNYGCDFFEQSCFDFIQNRTKAFSGSAFPFCSKYDMKGTLRGRDLKICFANETSTVKVTATCEIDYDVIDEYSSEYEIKPVTLNTQYSFLFRKWSKDVYGSNKEFRFCPMIANLFGGTFENLPTNAIPVKCPSN